MESIQDKLNEVNIEVEQELIYLILAVVAFAVVFLLLLFFAFIYLINPEVLFSPPESIGGYLSSLDPDMHRVVYGSEASSEEKEIAGEFVLDYLNEFRILESYESNSLVIGVGSSFDSTPYLEYLDDNDLIAVVDRANNNLFIYSKDLESLEGVSDVINVDLDYIAVKVNEGVVGELVV